MKTSTNRRHVRSSASGVIAYVLTLSSWSARKTKIETDWCCIDNAIKLNPNDCVVMALAGIVLVLTGDIDGGLRWIEKLVRHDPLSHEAWHEASFVANYLARRYDDAIDSVTGWRNPPTYLLAAFAATYAQLGRMDKAQAKRRKYESNLPEGYGFNFEPTTFRL